jgi:hypothetical protein
MDGVDDLGAGGALEVDRRNANAGVPELALDDDQRHALVAAVVAWWPVAWSVGE